MSDLHALAEASTVTPVVVKVEEIAAGCPCRATLLLPPGASGKQQVAALLKYVFDRHLIGLARRYNEGEAVVFGITDRKQYGNGFSAGRIDLADPGPDQITIDTGDGGISTGHEYVVSTQ
jgi:hypothetical protein